MYSFLRIICQNIYKKIDKLNNYYFKWAQDLLAWNTIRMSEFNDFFYYKKKVINKILFNLLIISSIVHVYYYYYYLYLSEYVNNYQFFIVIF